MMAELISNKISKLIILTGINCCHRYLGETLAQDFCRRFCQQYCSARDTVKQLAFNLKDFLSTFSRSHGINIPSSCQVVPNATRSIGGVLVFSVVKKIILNISL